MLLRHDSSATIREGMENAALRYRHLLQGGELAALPPSTLRLGPDEVCHVDMTVGYAEYFIYNPAEVIQAAGDAQHIRRVRRKMDEMTTPAWRGHVETRAVLTNRRLLIDGRQWRSLPHEHLLEITGDASELEFVLRYDGHDDVLLYGSPAPFFAVILAWLTYGPRGLRLPALEPIAAEGPEALPR